MTSTLVSAFDFSWSWPPVAPAARMYAVVRANAAGNSAGDDAGALALRRFCNAGRGYDGGKR
jgi:hypothetical protein